MSEYLIIQLIPFDAICYWVDGESPLFLCHVDFYADILCLVVVVLDIDVEGLVAMASSPVVLSKFRRVRDIELVSAVVLGITQSATVLVDPCIPYGWEYARTHTTQHRLRQKIDKVRIEKQFWIEQREERGMRVEKARNDIITIF